MELFFWLRKNNNSTTHVKVLSKQVIGSMVSVFTFDYLLKKTKAMSVEGNYLCCWSTVSCFTPIGIHFVLITSCLSEYMTFSVCGCWVLFLFCLKHYHKCNIAYYAYECGNITHSIVIM